MIKPEFYAPELVEFLSENSITARAFPKVDDSSYDYVQIGGQLEVHVDDEKMQLINTRKSDGAIIEGPYRTSYDSIITDVKDALSGKGLCHDCI